MLPLIIYDLVFSELSLTNINYHDKIMEFQYV